MEDSLLTALVADIDEAFVAYDADFTVRAINKRAEEMFGITAADFVGKQFPLEAAKDPSRAVFAGIMYPSLAPTLVRLSEAGAEPQQVKVVFENPRREFFASTRRVPTGFIKVVREVTREGSLMQSKSDFITVAAHQLRTPATAINWTFENLAKEGGLSDSAREAVSTGHAAAKNLLDVITRLLDAAQIEDGRFGYLFEPADLTTFLDVLLGKALPVGKLYGVNIYFDRPQEPIVVSADPSKLGMAIANIVDNGIKYNAPYGSVTVKLARFGTDATITITDTGVGITEADIPKLFQKFYRGEGTMKKVTEGTGLGLYLAKNIIEGHKGSIRVESAEGRGTTFYITIPLFLKPIFLKPNSLAPSA